MTIRVEKIGETLETIMDILEMLVFAALATAVIVGVVMLLAQTVAFATAIAAGPRSLQTLGQKNAGMETVGSEEARIVPIEAGYSEAKGVLLAILDTSLILIIGLDLLRTLVVAVVRKEFHMLSALEAGVLAMIREVIGAEVRHKTVHELLGYAVIIAILVGIWLLSRREITRMPLASGGALRAEGGGDKG